MPTTKYQTIIDYVFTNNFTPGFVNVIDHLEDINSDHFGLAGTIDLGAVNGQQTHMKWSKNAGRKANKKAAKNKSSSTMPITEDTVIFYRLKDANCNGGKVEGLKQRLEMVEIQGEQLKVNDIGVFKNKAGNITPAGTHHFKAFEA
ncbi:unnamed protein product [Ambrosiozyma monospora]|uniref:Unnamed protein product n=1 Tax=Ambrosiozyma monospora TaxID=43982 RepID=A0ACB5SVS8_AMBMO|nr:unnamed protein product [Ambrosiozyma monospora]